MICCGPIAAFFKFNPLGLTVGGSDLQQVESGDSCGGGTQIITGDFPTWWTDNTAIATANKNKITGVGVGETMHHAKSVPMYWGLKEYASSCPQNVQEPGGNTNVTLYTTVGNLTPLSITLLFPGLETGIGAVTAMQANPTTSNWNGYQLQEGLSTTSNSCPAFSSNICTGSSVFTVGQGGQAEVTVNGTPTPVGPVFPGQENIFYDQHTVVAPVSELDAYGINSCTTACLQVYTWKAFPSAVTRSHSPSLRPGSTGPT